MNEGHSAFPYRLRLMMMMMITIIIITTTTCAYVKSIEITLIE